MNPAERSHVARIEAARSTGRPRARPFLIALPAVNENKKDPMEVEEAVDALNAALRLQWRSALAYTYMAGTLVGFQFHGLAGERRSFALAELDDALDRDVPEDRADDRDAEDDRVARAREAVAGLRRSAAGTSSVTTAFVSVGISFSRKFAIRSSCRRYSRASLTVSASLSASASVSIAV